MQNIQIQKIQETEVKLLQEIAISTFVDTYAKLNTPANMETYLEKSFSIEKLHQELQNSESQFLFIKHDGEPIGYLKVNWGKAQTEQNMGEALEVERIYVSKAHQGKGIGRQLLHKAIQVARDKNLDFIWLGVWEKNPKALEFYSANKFSTFGTHSFIFGDEDQVDIMMKLEIKKELQSLEQYHLHKESPQKRQFELFDLATHVEKNIEHSSKPHSHSFYQLIWFYSNQGKHYVDFNSFEIKANTIFFIAKNQVHYFEKRADYEGVLLHINESFIVQNDDDMDIFLNYSLFNHLDRPYYQVPPHLEEKMQRYIKQIEEEVNQENAFGHAAILSNLLKSFLISIERKKRNINSRENFSKKRNLTFLKFRALLENNYRENLSVSQYAQQLNISTKTLNTVIKSETGSPPSKLISDRVILEAKRQLSHTHALVNEIGYDLGFQDPSYFVRYFKKHVSYTPKEFRDLISQ